MAGGQGLKAAVLAVAFAAAGTTGAKASPYAEVSKYPDVLIEFQGYQSCLTTGADLDMAAEEIVRRSGPKCAPKSAKYKMGKVFPKERIDGLYAEMIQFMNGVAVRWLKDEQARYGSFRAAMDTYATCVRGTAQRFAGSKEQVETIVRASFGKCLNEETALKDALVGFVKNRAVALEDEFPKLKAKFESRITYEVMEMREKAEKNCFPRSLRVQHPGDHGPVGIGQ
jgi:hypothetical protein